MGRTKLHWLPRRSQRSHRHWPHRGETDSATRLPAEEHTVQLPRLRRSEPWGRERFDCLVGHISLRTRERRRIAIPAQAGADVGVDASALAGQLVRHAVQLAHLVKQRFELLLVDGATLRARLRLDESLTHRHFPMGRFRRHAMSGPVRNHRAYAFIRAGW